MFSDMGPEYWSQEVLEPSVGLSVRTLAPLDDEQQKTMVYRVELVDKLKKAVDAERPRFDPTLPPGMRRF